MKKKLTELILMFVILITLSIAMTDNSYAIDNKPLSDMKAGNKIIFADKEWIILEPSTGYIILNSNDGNRQWDAGYELDSHVYETSDIGIYLNGTFFNGLGDKNKILVKDHTWNCGPHYNEASKTFTSKIGLLTYSEFSNYKDIVLNADNLDYKWWLMTTNPSCTSLGIPYHYYINTDQRIWSHNIQSYKGVRPALYVNPGLYVSTTKEIVQYTKSIILNLTTKNNQVLTTEDGYNTITISGSVDESDSKIYYRIDGSDGDAGTDLATIIDSYGNFSKEINLSSESEGSHTLYIWAEDTSGNKFGQVTRNFKIDTTNPTADKPKLESLSANSIKITSNASDSCSGLDTTPYLYIRDGNDIDTWTSDSSYTDTSLKANTLYKYKYKAKDKGGNEAESEEVSCYTLALNAESISKKSSSTSSIVFEITNAAGQTSLPEHRLELKLKDAGETGENKSASEWSSSTTRTISGLNDNTEYELWVQTRNSNETTNAKYKVDEIFKTNRIYHHSSTPSVPLVTPTSTKSKIKEAKNIESLKDTLTDIERLPSSQREEVRQELTKKAIDIMKDLSQLDFMQSTIDVIKDNEAKEKYQSRLNGKKMIYSENYKQWNKDNNTSEESNKVWNVKFNSSLDKESIKAEDDYITVVDEDGYRIKVKLEYNEVPKILKVIPLNNYEKGKKYYLIMGTKIKNSEGVSLDKPIRVEFDIE